MSDYVRDILMCLFSAVFGLMVWKIQRWQERQDKEMARREKIHQEDIEARAKWQQSITDNSIAMSQYHMSKIYRTAELAGFIYPDQLELFENLYVSYHALGGNGRMTAYLNHLRELPSFPQNRQMQSDWRAS